MQDIDDVRAAFTEPREFWSSPLYRRLSAVVAADPFLVEVAAHTRAGNGPTFAFFGAVHALLLDGAEHRLAEYYPSVRGDSATAPDDDAGSALTDFVRQHADALRSLLRTRLVQTNHVQRAFGLRLALAAIARDVGERPAHLLEIGSSAGLLLRQDRYGYLLGNRAFGDRTSPIQLAAEWRSTEPVPDVDKVPALASVTGLDLNPLDPRNDADRRWLEALVWPENRAQALLLRRALDLAAAAPVPTLHGDAVDLCPRWADALPAGAPRIVFHCATRMHVPRERRGLFDAAIAHAGRAGDLYHVGIDGDGLEITWPDGRTTTPYDVDGHLAWVRPRA